MYFSKQPREETHSKIASHIILRNAVLSVQFVGSCGHS